jgi:hypothetical protein
MADPGLEADPGATGEAGGTGTGEAGGTGTGEAGGTGTADAPAAPAWGAGVGPRSATAARPRSSTDDGRTAALVFGVVLIAVGAWFLAREWLPMLDLRITWPYVAVALGIALVVISLVRGRGSR